MKLKIFFLKSHALLVIEVLSQGENTVTYKLNEVQ